MKVKDKLSIQFTLMFGILLIIVLAGIYFFVEHNRSKTFDDKLDNRALTVAEFYLAKDNLSKENFKDVLKKFPQSLSHESIRIYNDNYEPKFVPEDSVHWNKEILKQVIAQQTVHLSVNDTQTAGLYYKDNSGNFIIMVSAIDETGHHDMSQLRLIMTLFFLFSLIVTFFMGRLFSRVALTPIIKITNNLKKIRSSSLDQRLQADEKKTDEIDILSITINQLLEHLEQSFGSQKSFIANASHELRTPITMILGEAEITLMKDRNKDEYKQTLHSIAKEAEGLRSIINSLMDMMQTNLESIDFQDVRMDELLWEIFDELDDKKSGNLVDVNYNLPKDPHRFTVQGNRQLLFIAISNIIKNAVKFSNDREVKCKISCDTKGINMVIQDHGIGIGEADLPKIFQPFFRSSNALSYPGNGIGLSLSRNIIKVHNGSINVTSELGEGTTFYIFLPNYNQ